MILICVYDRRVVSAIAGLVQHAFTNAVVLARSYDRGHAMELIRAGVDFEGGRLELQRDAGAGARRYRKSSAPSSVAGHDAGSIDADSDALALTTASIMSSSALTGKRLRRCDRR